MIFNGHVKRNCMTAPEYGSGLERVAGWNPAVVTINKDNLNNDSPVAQLEALLNTNQKVAGSDPVGVTN